MEIRCFGDSNTYGYDPRSFYGGRYEPENRWVDVLAQKSGCTIRNDGMNGREVPIVKDPHTILEDYLIIMLGTNDLLQGRSAEMTAKRMEIFLQSLELKKNQIILVAPPALKTSDWVTDQNLIEESIILGKKYNKIAEKYSIHFVDTSTWEISIAFDGVHFTEMGHHTFANSIYGYLQNTIMR